MIHQFCVITNPLKGLQPHFKSIIISNPLGTVMVETWSSGMQTQQLSFFIVNSALTPRDFYRWIGHLYSFTGEFMLPVPSAQSY